MSITIGNTQTTNFTTASSLVITKPTGLAVGDLMVAFCNSFGSDFNTPVGWTLSATESVSTLFSNVYTKTATSGDVAASNFTFARSSGSGVVSGSITAIPETLIDTTASGDRGTGSGDDNVTFSGLVQATIDNLLIIYSCFENGTNNGNVSGYAIANSNPTWTETFDLNDGGTDRKLMAMATAIRGTAGATGTVSYLLNNLNTFGFGCSHIISVSEIINASVAPSTINAIANIPTDWGIGQGVVGASSLNAIIQVEVGISTATNGIWTNDTQTATPTWVNDTQS